MVGTIGLVLRPSRLEIIIIVYFAMFVVATVLILLVHFLDKPDPSIVILKDDTIEFRGSATSNKEIELSNFDRLYYHEGFFRSFVQLERDEGERPNWYRANGRPADEDRKKLEKLIEIANSKMKDK